MRARLLAVVVATLAALALPVAPAGAAVVTTPPTIAGVAAVGQTVTAEPGSWDTEGLTLVHTWLLDGVAVADGPQYTPGPADQRHGLSVRETALQDGAPVGEATSDPVTVLGPAAASTSAPVITGDNHVGSVLEVSDGSWDAPDLRLSYQWLRAGEPIPGATGRAYTLSGPDWCQPVSVAVTASREGYADGVAFTDPVPVSCVIVETCCIPTGLRLRLVHEVVTPRQHPVLKVRLMSASNRLPRSGSVVVRVRGGRARTVDLRAVNAGRLTIRLPRQRVGRHPVQARFEAPPASGWADCSNVTLLRVRPARNDGR